MNENSQQSSISNDMRSANSSTSAFHSSTVEGSKSIPKILANIFISFIGAGILGLPYAFMIGGIVEGTLLMIFVGALSVKAMLLLIDTKYVLINILQNSDKYESHAALLAEDDEGIQTESNSPIAKEFKNHKVHQDISYGDLGYHALGYTGQLIVETVIVVSQLGFTCAYLIFISANLSDYIQGYSLFQWLMFLLPPLYLLTLWRHLSSLAFSSILAQCSTLLAFVVVFWFDFKHFHMIDLHPNLLRVKGFPFFLCIAIYSYEGAGMILSLEHSVAEEKRPKFKRYFIGAMVLCTTLYIMFGTCGYLSFGSETKQIITMNLPVGKSGVDIVMVVKCCLSLALAFTYPVMIFPVAKILESYFVKNSNKNLMCGNLLRLMLVLITGIVVLVVPNFANLMALVGATCCTLLAFILPGLFHLIICKQEITRCQRFIDIFLICFGIVGAVIGTQDALTRLVLHHLGTPVMPPLINLTHESTVTTGML